MEMINTPELMDKAQALESRINDLGAGDQSFARSLVKGYRKFGQLSRKQAVWVEKLLDRANNKEAPAKVNEGDVGPLFDLFESTKGRLKYPKIKIETATGDPLVLSVAGPRARCPGTINVTDGGPFGDNIWYGRITPDGKFQSGYSAEAKDRLGLVLSALRELAQHPAEVAMKYGKKTGQCCFCMKTLEQANSVAAGFGPVCADNWGLTEEWKNAAEAS